MCQACGGGEGQKGGRESRGLGHGAHRTCASGCAYVARRCPCPSASLPCHSAGKAPQSALPKGSEVGRVLTTTSDVGNVTRGPRITQVLRTGAVCLKMLWTSGWGGGGGQSSSMLLLSWQFVPIGLPRFTKIHQSRCVGPPRLFLRRWQVTTPPHRRIRTVIIFGASTLPRRRPRSSTGAQTAVRSSPGSHSIALQRFRQTGSCLEADHPLHHRRGGGGGGLRSNRSNAFSRPAAHRPFCQPPATCFPTACPTTSNRFGHF